MPSPMRGTAEKRRVSWLWWVSFWTSISINAEHPLAVESNATANWLPNRKRAVQVVLPSAATIDLRMAGNKLAFGRDSGGVQMRHIIIALALLMAPRVASAEWREASSPH